MYQRISSSSEQVTMRKLSQCLVCNRIPPKQVFALGHVLFNSRTDRNTVHNICVEAIHCINYADAKERLFFCGFPSHSILAGLFYILALKHNLKIKQSDISEALHDVDQGKKEHGKRRGRPPSQTSNYIPSAYYNAVSLRRGWMRWHEHFPELFPSKENLKKTVRLWMCERGKYQRGIGNNE